MIFHIVFITDITEVIKNAKIQIYKDDIKLSYEISVKDDAEKLQTDNSSLEKRVVQYRKRTNDQYLLNN